MLEEIRKLKFGYVPYREDAASAGDRRRFPLVAEKLGLAWEVFQEGGEYDVLLVTANADLTRFRRWQGPEKVIFELIDSYLDLPDWEPKAIIRGPGKWLLRRHQYLELSYRKTLEGMTRRADLVICSTPEQKEVMSAFNSNIHPILDIMDEVALDYRTNTAAPDGPYELLWEGLGYIALQFEIIAPVLQRLAKELPIRLHLVTDIRYKTLNLPWISHDVRSAMEKRLGSVPFFISEWNSTSLTALAKCCHLGLIPLPTDKPLYRAKPENKLRLMWNMGLPTVTSATVAYKRCMSGYGGPNWASETLEDWYANIKAGLLEPELRTQAASKAAQYLQDEYATELLVEKWVRALGSLL